MELDIQQISSLQQNQYPLLFLDRVTDLIPGVSCTGIKTFSYNEWFFPVHFKNDPSVPGFIQIECMVQAFMMTFITLDECKGKLVYGHKINNVQYRKKIVPGDILNSFCTLKSLRRGLASGHVDSYVSDKKACSADFTVVIPDLVNNFLPSQ